MRERRRWMVRASLSRQLGGMAMGAVKVARGEVGRPDAGRHQGAVGEAPGVRAGLSDGAGGKQEKRQGVL